MGAKNRPVGNCPVEGSVGGIVHPLADRPFCPRIILGLNRAQPSHDRIGRLEFRPCDTLGVQPLMRNVRSRHHDDSLPHPGYVFAPRCTIRHAGIY